MNKKYIIGITIGVVALAGYYFFFGRPASQVSSEVVVDPKVGKFQVVIETSGELEAKNSVEIKGPTTLRNFGIWNLNIQNIIDEGAIVKKGDWVATLDRSELQNRYNTKELELEKATSRYIQTQLDTTLQMRQSRDELINLKYGVDERDIILKQSQYEPPATIKQAEINLEKAERALQQAEENYKIKQKQNVEKMREVAAEVRKVRDELKTMSEVITTFSVKAPEDGMVIYKKGYDNKPIKAGSQISMWDPVVATLPDLSVMMSVTYVNEVDVRRVKKGQTVELGLDAYPDKVLRGKVVRVANVGEQRANSDSKVFQVSIEIQGEDSTLRPAMTTSNSIIAKTLDSVLFIPLECLHSFNDTVTYVFVKDGLSIIKQEVMVGERNASDAVIEKGLSPSQRLYLSVPKGIEDKQITLLPEMEGKRLKKETELPAPAQMELPAYSFQERPARQ